MAQILPQRKSPRLQGYDYSQSGVYFITICTYGRLHLFGDIHDGIMNLNDLGRLVQIELVNLPKRWNGVDVESSVVMPNHIHAMIIFVGTPFLASESQIQTDAQKRVPTLGQVVGNFKAGVTRAANQSGSIPDDAESGRIWQSRYHDHIIRDEQTFNRIQQYIMENPARWEQDRFFSANNTKL